MNRRITVKHIIKDKAITIENSVTEGVTKAKLLPKDRLKINALIMKKQEKMNK